MINFCDAVFLFFIFFWQFWRRPPFDDRVLVGCFGWWKRLREAVLVEQCSRS